MRARRSTLGLLAVFLVALVTYVFVRPDAPETTAVEPVRVVSPVPTPTPSPTPSVTPTPTDLPEPSPTEDEPSDTPVPTPEPTAEPTSSEDAEVERSPSPLPSA